MKPKSSFISIPLIAVFLLSVQIQTTYSQEVMKIKKKDNTIISIPMSEIAGISFSGSDQLPDNEFADIDGNIYKIVKIGLQSWAGSNLNVSRFRNGDPILEAKSDEEWIKAGKKGKPAWCYYLNSSENGPLYGKLYNWYAVNDKRGLAPKGWRVAFDQDWDALSKGLGDIPGAKLKEAGKNNWLKNADNVTNETGFTVLPSGSRFAAGKFSGAGSQATLWTSTENTLNEG
ncbi:MAG: fibrobacter succinogenes major paralogous domain-containing protein [Candidatus Delongbacteria bacterium]|nr:fibrobacter succinogenes major paralogous domain-containing protein [Candidatus Delongbacteria bacterium]